jgi:hypothetical protein
VFGLVTVKCQVRKQMLLSSRNRRQEACPKANEDKKERLEGVDCEYKIALSNACKVVGIWPAIGIQMYT